MNKSVEKYDPPRDGSGHDPWIRTANGGRFHYLRDNAYEYDMDVVAAALSRICRYGGHIKDEFEDDIYSVAQHSVYVLRLLMMKRVPDYCFPWAILHDAPEAYYMDLVSPLKHELPNYEAMENRSAEGMRARYGIPYDDSVKHYVKWADNQLYFAERLRLTEIPIGEECLAPEPEFTLEEIDPNFYLWRPSHARKEFKAAYAAAMLMYQGYTYADAS